MAPVLTNMVQEKGGDIVCFTKLGGEGDWDKLPDSFPVLTNP